MQKHIAQSRGFTLIELMITVAIVAILAAIAVPSYQSFVRKGIVKTAEGDLQALQLTLENSFRRTLAYPASAANRQEFANKPQFNGWAPGSKIENFEFAYTNDAGNLTLVATGLNMMLNCELKVTRDKVSRSYTDNFKSPSNGCK